MNEPLNHLHSIWYHSTPQEVPFPQPGFLVETFFFYFLKQTCSDTIWGLQIFMLCMDSQVVHHLSPNIHNRQWDCISHKTFPFFAFHHHSFLSIFSKKSSLNMSKSLSINNKFSTKLNVYCKS